MSHYDNRFQHLVIDKENTYYYTFNPNVHYLDLLSQHNLTYYNYANRNNRVFSMRENVFSSSNADERLNNIYSQLIDKDYFSSPSPYYPPILSSYNLESGYSIPTSLLDEYHNKTYGPRKPLYSYPIATRYISNDGTIYIERPPFQAVIDFKPAGAYSRTKKRLTSRKVWIPWSIFTFNPSYPQQSQKMFFSHKSLSSYEDLYFPTFLPNTYLDGRICYSNSLSTLPLDQIDQQNISSLYSYMINEYFAGSWNSDLTNPMYTIFHSLYKIFLKDPTCVEKYPLLNLIITPSLDLLSSSGALDYKPLAHHASYFLSLYENHYSVPSNSWLSSLDLPSFHYYILSIFSTFSLQQVLDLYEELADFYRSNTSKSFNSNFKSFSDITKLDYTSPFSGDPYIFSERTQPLFQSLMHTVSQIAVHNDTFPDYTQTPAYVLYINGARTVSNSWHTNTSVLNKSSYVHNTILNTICSNFKYNTDYYSHNLFYVYDCLTDTLTHIPENLYHSQITDTTSSYHNFYLDLTEKFYQNSSPLLISDIFPTHSSFLEPTDV